MSHQYSVLLAGLGLSVALQAAHAEEGETPPGVEALEEFRTGAKPPNPVQNRFFLKSKRFEITPLLGVGPNNPFADRFPTASLAFGYHFSEQLAVSGIFTYAPDLGKGDVKALVPILLQRADDDDFQQPLDKVTLAASVGVTWSPVYGKINIIGETVLNFDFYGFLGVGFVLQNEYAAVETRTSLPVSRRASSSTSSPALPRCGSRRPWASVETSSCRRPWPFASMHASSSSQTTFPSTTPTCSRKAPV